MHFSNVMMVAALAVLMAACGGGDGSSSQLPDSSSSLSTVLSSSSSSSVSSSSVASSMADILSVEMDGLVKNIIQESGATAATVAIAQNGKIVFEQGYGFLNINKTIATTPDTLMRMASLVKPVTAAAVRKLAATGVLALSDHVFCNGNNAPCWLPANLLSITSDSRAKDITVEHLIAHQGGWYATVSGDPLEQELEIRQSFGLSAAPSREDIVRYVMQRPLDFTPGVLDYVNENYSNFGYLLLGMVIEQATNASYIDYVQANIMAPLGVSAADFKLATSLLAEHDSREPAYVSADICPSVFNPGKNALCSEEGADLKNWNSAAGIIATAKAMALFAQHYRLPKDPRYFFAHYGNIGEPLPSITNADGSHVGSLPGTSALVRQLPSGVSYAIYLNAYYDIPSYEELDRVSQLAP